MFEERLNFRSEDEEPAVPIVIKRLDAEPVPRAEQTLFPAIPESKDENATEACEAPRAIFFVAVQDRFGVGVRCITMTGALQLRAQSGMVEDFAVVDDPQRGILIGHRLPAGREVDDTQPAMAKKDAIITIEP